MPVSHHHCGRQHAWGGCPVTARLCTPLQVSCGRSGAASQGRRRPALGDRGSPTVGLPAVRHAVAARLHDALGVDAIADQPCGELQEDVVAGGGLGRADVVERVPWHLRPGNVGLDLCTRGGGGAACRAAVGVREIHRARGLFWAAWQAGQGQAAGAAGWPPRGPGSAQERCQGVGSRRPGAAGGRRGITRTNQAHCFAALPHTHARSAGRLGCSLAALRCAAHQHVTVQALLSELRLLGCFRGALHAADAELEHALVVGRERDAHGDGGTLHVDACGARGPAGGAGAAAGWRVPCVHEAASRRAWREAFRQERSAEGRTSHFARVLDSSRFVPAGRWLLVGVAAEAPLPVGPGLGAVGHHCGACECTRRHSEAPGWAHAERLGRGRHPLGGQYYLPR